MPIRNTIIISLVSTLLFLEGSLAGDKFSSPLTGKALIELMRSESEKSSQNILITPKLLNKVELHNSVNQYDLNEIQFSEIDNWQIWHHREENIDSIRQRANSNMDLIAKYLPKDLASHSYRIEFAGVQLSVAAISYANICEMPPVKIHSAHRTSYIWSLQAEASQVKEVCLDYGLQLATIGASLSEKDNVLVVFEN